MHPHRKVLALLAATALLAACGKTVDFISLNPTGNFCQFTERRSFLMTAGVVVCWDRDYRPIGMGVTSGKPIAGVVGDAALAGGILGAGVAIGSGVKGVANVEVTVP